MEMDNKDYSEKPPKERIMFATIELMRETGDPEALTVRAIAARAGVGIGLINYHFTNKNKMIREAARFFIKSVIIRDYGSEFSIEKSDDLKALLTQLLLGPIGFICSFPRISRISILYDLSSPLEMDNTDQTFTELMTVLKKLFPETVEGKLSFHLWMVLGSIHEAFLRSDLLLKRAGINIFDKKHQREYAGQLASFLIAAFE